MDIMYAAFIAITALAGGGWLRSIFDDYFKQRGTKNRN